MKVEFIIILIFFVCCKPKAKMEKDQRVKVESVNIETQKEISNENFDDFFIKFKTDSLFQQQRIDKPISVIISDEETEKEEKQAIKFVSFDQKAWDVKIGYQKTTISKDTMNVILEGMDTDGHVEHIFVKRDLRWYLSSIKNLSD